MDLEFISKQTSELSRIVDHTINAGGIAVINSEGIIEAISAAWMPVPGDAIMEALTNVPIGQSLFGDAGNTDEQRNAAVTRFLESVRRILQGKAESLRQEIAVPSEAPSRWFNVSVTRLAQTEQALISVLDVTALRRAENTLEFEAHRLESQFGEMQNEWQRLEALVTLDGLTGLKNYRTLQERLQREWERTQRYGYDLSLMLLDVDNFKDYNDAYGHLAGNQVLQYLAEALRTTARETDIAARYGGEEFAILLPNTDEAGAIAMARRFQDAVHSVAWPNRPVTVSIGLVSWKPTFRTSVPDPLRLLEHADEALYAAKQAGRNTTISYSTLAPSDVLGGREGSDGENL